MGSAALLGAALYWLDFRPWLAGLLIGLLAYKPQFGVLLEAAALASASLRATPYVMDYDLVVVAIAMAFFARHGLKQGFHDYEIGMLAAAWVVPLLSRSVAGIAAIPLGLMVMPAFYTFVLRRAALDREVLASGEHRVAQA
jgi:alpha-1,2-mannosyltransferase